MPAAADAAGHPASASDGRRGSAQLVLASASPRRAELLTTLGLRFEVRAADVDESVDDGEAPATYVERVARAKAAAVSAAILADSPPDITGAAPDAVVVAADTTVVLDGQILGKPTDTDEARFMLRSLAGRTHEVLTAVVASGSRPRRVACGVDRRHLRRRRRRRARLVPRHRRAVRQGRAPTASRAPAGSSSPASTAATTTSSAFPSTPSPSVIGELDLGVDLLDFAR